MFVVSSAFTMHIGAQSKGGGGGGGGGRWDGGSWDLRITIVIH